MKPVRARVALLSASALLSLTLAEATCRALLPRPGFQPFPVAEVDGVFRPDSVRGYRYAAEEERRVVTPDFEITFRTNELGMRDEALAAGTAEFGVLAVGDSYTQGHGVEASEAWPEQLESLLHDAGVVDVRVYNAGVSGYGLVQMRQTISEMAPVVEPDLVVVGLYLRGYHRVVNPYTLVGDGAGVVTGDIAPRVVVERDGVFLPSFDGALARRVDVWLKRHTYFGGHLTSLAGDLWGRLRGGPPPPPVPLSEDLGPFLEALEETQALADRLGVPMIGLLVTPQEPDGSFAAEERVYRDVLVPFAEARGIEIVDPLPAFEEIAGGDAPLRLGGDRHWSPLAHRIAAEVLATWVVEAGYPPTAGVAGGAGR